MSTVRLSKKNARAVVAHLEHIRAKAPDLVGALVQLRDGLAPRRAKPIAISARRAKVAKRATKNAETTALYAKAEQRAGGKCEACGLRFMLGDLPELDHALGRGRVRQSERNVWLIHRSCHRARHGGRPSRAYWLEKWIAHCDRYGFAAEAEHARDELVADDLIDEASAISAEAGR